MYYSNGNYEAFARPRKPAGVEAKSAYLIGAGLASLAAAAFLIRDARMPGMRIHVLEALDLPGGACDGIKDAQKGFIIRGGREMEDHFECLWDLFHSIPSLETPEASVLDEFYWLNKDDPNVSLVRATVRRGEDAHTDGKFALSPAASQEIMKLFFAREGDLEGKAITDVFGREFFTSNFWLYWRTMFAFQPWHSAIEMRRYLQRFVHHIGGLPDFSALKFTKYNQYESLIKPLVAYLESHHVTFEYGVTVTNVIFDTGPTKLARRIVCTRGGREDRIDLTADDLVFITPGGCAENSTLGDHHTAPAFDVPARGGWDLWRQIAAQDPSFGRPATFCSDPARSNWESATITVFGDEIPPYIEKVCRRDPFSGKVVTGGIVTVKDSGWLMSYTLNRQPHFADQPKDQLVVWVYGLFTNRPGTYVRKAMRDCTGEEITREWLYHLGVPVGRIDALAATSARCVPCMMPYVTAFFMPRRAGDRPKVVPDGCVNAAFIGQFAETPRDTVFTTEYSVRTALEAVYTLLGVDRGVPEVFGSCYDVRVLLDAMSKLADGATLAEMAVPLPVKAARGPLLKKLIGTLIGDLLHRYRLM